MFEFARPFAEDGQRDMQGRLGRMYRDGRGVDVDLNTAAMWMRKAADQNLKWAKNELFDILWMINTSETDKEMFSVASSFASLGNGGAMGRLARCYRDGRGVEKNQDSAIEWMQKAAKKKVPWAITELESMTSVDSCTM